MAELVQGVWFEVSRLDASMLGRFYLGPGGEVWRLVSYCEYPTVSWENVRDPLQRRGGAVGSILAREFTLLDVASATAPDGASQKPASPSPGATRGRTKEGDRMSDVERSGSEPEARVVDQVSDEMVCDRCKRRHGVVWFAPSDIWNAVMRGGDRSQPDEFCFCCPICFMALAQERGVTTSGWLVTPFSDGPVRTADRMVLRNGDGS